MKTDYERRMEPVRAIVAKAFGLPDEEVLPVMDGVGFFTLQYGERIGVSFRELDNFAATVLMTPKMAKQLIRDLQRAVDGMEKGGGVQ